MGGGKFNVNSNEVNDYINIIEKYSTKIVSTGTSKSISRDADDDKILQCGFDGGVDYIITGDKDLLVLQEYGKIKIVTSSAYLKIVRAQQAHNE